MTKPSMTHTSRAFKHAERTFAKGLKFRTLSASSPPWEETTAGPAGITPDIENGGSLFEEEMVSVVISPIIALCHFTKLV